MSFIADNGLKNNDPVLPGEQWFCYWKTSASLWESRILQSSHHEILFIPIYWGLHSDGPDQWDFGRVQPERDLLRLSQLLKQHNRKFCWLLPLTPAPFLPNGGVPVVAARTLSISMNGSHIATLDQEEILNKMYSFFEPKVFQCFVDFLSAFGKFLGENKIKAPVWGSTFHYLEVEESISYLEDYSTAFEQGFSRYLRQNFKEGINLSDPMEENRLKVKFTEEVHDLFRTTAESALGPFWMGQQKIMVLGGSPEETIQRSLKDGKTQLNFIADIFKHYTFGNWISSVLLRKSERGEILKKVLLEHFGTEEVERRYHYQALSGELTEEWRPFGLIDLFDKHGMHFKSSGLLSYLEKNFPWTYQIHRELPFTTEWIEGNQHKVKFFHGADLDRTLFSQMLKLFLMGQRVVLDRSGLSTELDKRLQIFYLENNLKLQSVNFITGISLCELGEGKFITYDGPKLTPENGEKFWGHLFKYFKLDHLDVNLGDDVFGLWRIRATSSVELNYLDVRRVNLYNPTSYKKSVNIHAKNGFAFMRMIDPSRASAKSHTHGVDVELLPNGRIGLDFGHYEENS